MSVKKEKEKPYPFPNLQAFSKVMGRDDAFIEREVGYARATQAPPDAVYRVKLTFGSHEDPHAPSNKWTWRTLDQFCEKISSAAELKIYEQTKELARHIA